MKSQINSVDRLRREIHWHRVTIKAAQVAGEKPVNELAADIVAENPVMFHDAIQNTSALNLI